MFTDAPFVSLLADQRHRELLAEAEQHRLARLARAARRLRRRTPRPAPPEPERSVRRDTSGERRSLVPR